MSMLTLAPLFAGPALSASSATAVQPDQALRRRVAACIAATPSRALTDWLNALPGTSEEMALAGRFSLAPCLANQPAGWAKFGERDGQFRMFVVEALVNGHLRTLPFSSPVPVSDARWYDTKWASRAPDAPVDRQALALDDFGTCVAMKDWADALAFLRAPAGSASQSATLQRLTPFFGPCTTLDLHMDRPTLRLILASGVYRIAVAAKLTALSR